jgi:N-acetylneuraminic acid mutarotase
MRRLAWLALAVAVVSACGFPTLSPLGGGDGGGGDGGGGSGGTLLAAIDEPYAKLAGTITLEGDFTDGLRVAFPGGVTASATLLGPNRATVVVPDGATTGRLSVADSGAATSLPFRATTFDVALGYFDDNYHQADYARAMPQYRTSYAPTMVSDDAVYVLGGATIASVAIGPAAFNSIARASINADGTLDDFVPATDHLLTPRAFAGSARVGDTTYLIGGFDDQGNYLDTIERASLEADGTFDLATLATKLTTRRFDPTCAVIGHWLYVIGGKDQPNHVLNTIERAQINPDGSLGAFAMVTGELQMPRYGASSVVYGTTLYVAGGADQSNALANAEQAPIAPDGELGGFTRTAGNLSTGRLDAYAMIAGDKLYVIGGEATTAGMYVANADVGVIAADGSIAAFTTKASLLANARGGFATARVGNFLYAIGGSQSPSITLSSVEAASIAGNMIGSFGTDAVTLTTGRHGHASVVIGRWLYVIGGQDNLGHRLATIERAPIGLDGTLGPFAPFGESLLEGRVQPNVAVLGGQLYVIGGSTDINAQGTVDIEQAAIDASGGLGAFDFSGNLDAPRYGATAAVVDGFVIVFGGSQTGTPTIDGEHAPQIGGHLGPFEAETTAMLTDPAFEATPAVSRRRFYVVLGGTTSFQASKITTSGSTLTMGPFATDTTAMLRTNTSSVWTGDTLYILGGKAGASDLASILGAASNEVGDIGAGFVMIGPSLPMGISGQTSTILGNHVYTVGGTGSTMLKAVFEAVVQ